MTASAKQSSSTTHRTTRVPASSRRREITLAGRTARDVEQSAAPSARDQAKLDRLATLKAKGLEMAARKAERAELKARLAAKASAEDAEALKACNVIIGRIERRAADQRARRKLETSADRRRANLLRKNPHTERGAAIQVGRRIVTDPETIGGFIEVQVNKQLDVLTTEHSARRISDVEFAVGRLLQDAWTGNRDGGDRRMASMSRLGVLVNGGAGSEEELPPREMEMLRSVFRIRAIADLDAKIADVIGWVGVRFLKAILVEGHTIGTYASRTVGGGERGAARIGDRFRWMLAEVAEQLHTATGAGGQRIRATRSRD